MNGPSLKSKYFRSTIQVLDALNYVIGPFLQPVFVLQVLFPSFGKIAQIKNLQKGAKIFLFCIKCQDSEWLILSSWSWSYVFCLIVFPPWKQYLIVFLHDSAKSVFANINDFFHFAFIEQFAKYFYFCQIVKDLPTCWDSQVNNNFFVLSIMKIVSEVGLQQRLVALMVPDDELLVVLVESIKLLSSNKTR